MSDRASESESSSSDSTEYDEVMTTTATQRSSPIRLLLIDFDRTLTKEHTGGALCFNNRDTQRCLNPTTGVSEENFCDNVSSGDAAFTLELLLSLPIEQNICVAIITMSDQRHESFRTAFLETSNGQRRNNYNCVGGEKMVRHWIFCLAFKALGSEYMANLTIEHLFATKRFFIVAKFHPNSKMGHLNDALMYFSKHQTLSSDLKANEILYIDDSDFLLHDLSSKMPGIQTVWTPNGLTKQRWAAIQRRYLSQ